jgi:hypothetical protein
MEISSFCVGGLILSVTGETSCFFTNMGFQSGPLMRQGPFTISFGFILFLEFSYNR